MCVCVCVCGGGGGVYLTLHCHHQNDSCVQMGSNVIRFNVSLWMSKVTICVLEAQLLKRKETPKATV